MIFTLKQRKLIERCEFSLAKDGVIHCKFLHPYYDYSTSRYLVVSWLKITTESRAMNYKLVKATVTAISCKHWRLNLTTNRLQISVVAIIAVIISNCI